MRLIAPTNTQPDPNTTISSGACTARLFDERHETTLDADEATSQTTLSVARARSIEVGSSCSVQLDDGSYHDGGAVISRDLDADTITITTGLASAAGAGSRVMTSLGADVAMSAYGTPVLGATDWGFEGTIDAAHAGIAPGMPIRIEITLGGAAPDLLEVIRETVVVGF